MILALRSAAAQARMPAEKMTQQELSYFSHMTKHRASVNLYLYYRNKIVINIKNYLQVFLASFMAFGSISRAYS